MPSVETPVSAPADRKLISRRAFLSVAGAVTVGLALDAGEIDRHHLVLEQPTIRVANLPEGLDGLRVAQISDIHFAEYTEPFFVERAVDAVNALNADIVLVTGDFVTMGPIVKTEAQFYAPVVAKILAAIRCPHKWGVLGNHDWMVNGQLVTEAMNAAGIRMLVNQYEAFEQNGARLWLGGAMDALSQDCDIPASIPPHARRDGEPVLLMVHEPDMLPVVAQLDAVDLMLSGHTHGGQVRLPFLPPLFLPPLGKRFVEGHFQMGRTQLYVNRGLGAVGLPFRFRCPAEVTEITLRRA